MLSLLRRATRQLKPELAFLLGLALMLLVWPVLAQDSSARQLISGETMSGVLDAENLAQMYTFPGFTGERVSLTVTTGPGVALLLTDEDGEPLARTAADTEDERVTLELPAVTLPRDGRYYVMVFVYSDSFSDGAFDLRLDAEAAPETTETVAQPGQIVTTSGMQVTLTWDSTADLNLQVRDPLGGTLYWDSRTADNGGAFGFDANGLCEVLTSTPSEVASWPGGALAAGSYEILVFYRQSCLNEGPVSFTVDVVVDGESLPPIQGTLPFAGESDQVFVSSFVIEADGTATVRESGIYDALTASPRTVPDPADASPITVNQVVRGSVANDGAIAAFTFEGQANQVVSIEMSRTLGSLDTLLFLMAPNGDVLASNDDVEFGSTDSAIQNFRLPVAGQYTIIATRYGQELGGTQGNYALTLSGPTSDVPPEVLALNLPTGDIEVTLLWNTLADLQLLVRDPSLDSVFDDTPSVPSGGRLVAAGNVNCTQTQTQPVSYIYWPEGFLRAGTYEVDVWYQNTCEDTRPVDFTLIVTVDGEVVFIETARPVPGDQYVMAFTVDVSRAVTVRGGGIMNLSAIDYSAELDDAPSVESARPLTGNLSFENPFDVYVYEGEAGDVVNINMRATGGNLDTLLYVLDPDGNLLRSNDDATPGEVTNSLIGDLSLGQDGQYIILATRFGILYGATTGTYELSVTQRS